MDLKEGKQRHHAISHAIYACFQTVLRFEYKTKKKFSFENMVSDLEKDGLICLKIALEKKVRF